MRNITRVQCPIFYSDMASIFLGLFEYVREYKPYKIFVVYNIEDRTMVYSSTPPPIEKQNDDLEREHINESLEFFRLSTLLFAPYISSHPLFTADDQNDAAKKKTVEKKISQCFGSDKEIAHAYSLCGSAVYFVVLANESIAGAEYPVMIDTLFDMALVQWRDCFKNGTRQNDESLKIRPIGGSANEMIESRADYLEVSSLFGVVTSISSQYYEHSKSCGHISITQFKNCSPAIAILPIPFVIENARQLRKLLEMTRDDFAVLVHDQCVYGIGKTARVEYSFNISNHMEWSMNDSNGAAVLRYKHGRYYVPLAVEMEGWYIEEKLKSMGENSSNIKKIVAEIRKANHGAILIVSDEKVIKKEVKRLCDRKYGLAVMSKVDLIEDCISNNGEVIRAVSAIDGACFIDFQGYCYGFGIILDGKVATDGTSARGSRYNSAKNYVAQWKQHVKHDVFAYVQSDDGDIDIMSSNDKNL